MAIRRILKHWRMSTWQVRHCFSPATLTAIEEAVAHSEKQHRSELRFVIEGRLSLLQLLRGLRPRQRAIEQFDQQGVGNTAERSGILIYVLLAEHQVEIVADTGIASRVAQTEWDALCHGMTGLFGEGRYRDGALHGIAQATRLLVKHFPAGMDNPNELPDQPLVL